MEQRRFERVSFMESINFSLSVLEFKTLKRLNLTAQSIDISEGGIGIQIDYPLEPGHVIRFNNGINFKPGKDYLGGIVRWSTRLYDINAYRAGVEFI